jgi:hypothetical protein
VKINQDKLDLWLHDLRTTTDPQTRCVLTNMNGDCCLGRLCKVAIADGVPIRVRLHYRRGRSDGDNNTHYSYDGAVGAPPLAVENWVGRGGLLTSACTQMNDIERLSFKEIADRVEAMVRA